jgi:hypothetical protein
LGGLHIIGLSNQTACPLPPRQSVRRTASDQAVASLFAGRPRRQAKDPRPNSPTSKSERESGSGVDTGGRSPHFLPSRPRTCVSFHHASSAREVEKSAKSMLPGGKERKAAVSDGRKLDMSSELPWEEIRSRLDWSPTLTEKSPLSEPARPKSIRSAQRGAATKRTAQRKIGLAFIFYVLQEGLNLP